MPRRLRKLPKGEVELSPQFDSGKSFYGKAKVKQVNGKRVLQSYQTDVAEISNGKPFVRGTYSPTTTRHIREFLKQSGFKAESGKQIIKDYGKRTVPAGRVSQPDNSMLKSVAMVAKMGDIIGGKTLKEKNAWKVRMLKAGLSKRGLMIPKDFGNISEREKKKRLNKAIGVLTETRR